MNTIKGVSLHAEVYMDQEHEGFVEAAQLEGRYANYFQVGHNALEFLFDFGQFFPESTQARFHTRIITSPVYALAFLRTVQKSISEYERSFGAIAKEDEAEA